MSALLALVLLAQSDYVRDLNDKDPVLRMNACGSLARKDLKSAIPSIIGLLKTEKDDDVRKAAVDALERLTGVTAHGQNAEEWGKWWDEVGIKTYPVTNLSAEEVHRIIQPKMDEVDKDLESFKSEIRILSIVVGIIALAFVLVMIYFVGHVSSKLKEWKDLVKQAGVYIEESQQITKRTDRVLEELEVKKVDILEFVKKLKEEKESEIERYVDLMQQNTEHRTREEVMELRQKAEKELQETLGQMRQQIEMEFRRVVSGQKEKVDKDFKDQHDRFLREVDAHTLFLEANFNHVNGKAEDALRLYKRIVGIKPDHQVAWEKLGNVYRDLLRYDEAIEAYEKAIELSPDDPSAYYNMAATFAKQRKRERMLETLTQAIKNDGEFKDEALNDQAFREYWNDPAFKDLAEA